MAFVVTVLLTAGLIAAQAKEPKATVTWAGIDYGLAHFVGTADFDEPAEIPPYFTKWNGLVLLEQLDTLERRLGRPIRVDVEHLVALHEGVDPAAAIDRNDLRSAQRPYLSEAIVAERLKVYPVDGAEGVGLVLVADQLNKPWQVGCYWVTWFDRADLELLSTTYDCGEARGFGFRNYWFGTAKDVFGHLGRRDVP